MKVSQSTRTVLCRVSGQFSPALAPSHHVRPDGHDESVEYVLAATVRASSAYAVGGARAWLEARRLGWTAHLLSV